MLLAMKSRNPCKTTIDLGANLMQENLRTAKTINWLPEVVRNQEEIQE